MEFLEFSDPKVAMIHKVSKNLAQIGKTQWWDLVDMCGDFHTDG